MATLAKNQSEMRQSRTWVSSLYIRFSQQKKARESDHVVGNFRPSDRPGEQFRSFSVILQKKNSDFREINPRSFSPSPVIFQKPSHFFLKINQQSNRLGSGKFANKTLSFYKINLWSWSSLRIFLRKIHRF